MPASFTFKAGDALYAAFECRTVDTLLAFGNNGRVYSVPVAALPGGRGDGVPVTTLIELESGTRSAALLRGDRGSGAAARVEQRLRLHRQGRRHGEPREGGQVVHDDRRRRRAARADADRCRTRRTLPACRESGRLLVFGLDEMKTLSGGGRGVTLMELDPKETLVQALAIDAEGVMLIGTGRGGKLREEKLAARRWCRTSASARARAARRNRSLKVSELRPVFEG